MNTLTIAVLTRVLLLRAAAGDWLTGGKRRDERGSATTDFALWAVAVIAFVGLVTLAISAFLDGQVAKLQ